MEIDLINLMSLSQIPNEKNDFFQKAQEKGNLTQNNFG